MFLNDTSRRIPIGKLTHAIDVGSHTSIVEKDMYSAKSLDSSLDNLVSIDN